MLKAQEGALLAQNFKRSHEQAPGSNPSTPRAPGAGLLGYYTTPQKVGAIPAAVDTGCKKQLAAPDAKKSRWDQGASSSTRNLGPNFQLQLQQQDGDESIFTVRARGGLSGNRDAFTIAGSGSLRTVAGKAVQFDGRQYVFLEKKLSNSAHPKYAHGGVLEESADGEWRVRQRYVPAMSLGLAERYMGPLPRDKVKRLEDLVARGSLNDFFCSGNLSHVGDIADQWTQDYPRRITNWNEDAKVFGNKEGKLPIKQSALELTCRGRRFERGEMRLVLDQQGHLLFTPDHYRSFVLLTPSSPARVHVNALPMSVASRLGHRFDLYHLARFLLGQPVESMRSAFDDQGVFDGKGLHQFQEISSTEFDQLQLNLGRNLLPGFDRVDCRRISATGMVVALPPGHDRSGAPRVFVEGYIGTRFSEVVSDKGAETSLAYFEV